MAQVEIPEDHRRTPSTPRVRPRVPIEDLVNRDAHPARRKITGTEKRDDRLHWTSLVALVALGVFWAMLGLSGLLGAFLGLPGAMAPLGFAVASLVVSWRIEAE